MITLRFNRAWLTETGWSKRKKNTPFPYDDPQTLKANMPGKKGKNDKGYVYVKPPLKPSAITDLMNTTFTTLLAKSKKMNTKDHGSLDLVMVGDSQLHTPVFGSGFPDIISAELNGMFRWGSKSWSGFDVPDIFLEVVPPSAPLPRVVVLTFLPNKFYQGKKAGKLNPKPLPPVSGTPSSSNGSDSAVPDQAFTARVKITGVPKRRNPEELEYREALNHYPAVVSSGPYKGQEIGIRSWSMYDAQLRDKAFDLKPGTTIRVSVDSMERSDEKTKNLSNHMVFNDSEQDLLIPIFWVTKGPLAPKSLKIPQQ